MTERKIQVGDIVVNTRVEGRSDAPWVTFCNSLATDLSMYDAQAAALAAGGGGPPRRGPGEAASPAARRARPRRVRHRTNQVTKPVMPAR